MDYQESEYLDEHGKHTPCRNCMPGQELSKVNRLLCKDRESSSTEAFTVLGESSASLPSEGQSLVPACWGELGLGGKGQ